LVVLASNQAFAEVTCCNRLAGSPLDPNRVVAGIRFLAMKVPEAVAACRAAIASDGSNPRLWYQLCLALVKSGDYADAFVAYRKAADQGCAATEDDLGGMYAGGRGIPEDDAQAGYGGTGLGLLICKALVALRRLGKLASIRSASSGHSLAVASLLPTTCASGQQGACVVRELCT
jgi:hypothetical protein